jgi:hypothetical protein
MINEESFVKEVKSLRIFSRCIEAILLRVRVSSRVNIERWIRSIVHEFEEEIDLIRWILGTM